MSQLYCSTNINPKNFKISPFFNPEHVTALSKEENKSCKGLVNEKNVQKRSKTSTITKPWAMMVCQLNSWFSWADIFHDILASYNFAFQQDMISMSQRWGIISLIPQKIQR